MGGDPSKISAHYSRYGGATTLAAAGIPQYLIEYFGGWAEGSESLRFYAQVGGDAVSRVSQVMADGVGVSLTESRLRVSNRASTDKVGDIRVCKENPLSTFVDGRGARPFPTWREEAILPIGIELSFARAKCPI